MIASWQKNNYKPRQCIEKQRHYSANKEPYSQGYGLPSAHVRLWELDHKEGRMPKNWCLWTVVLEKTRKNPLDSKEIRLVNLQFSSVHSLSHVRFFATPWIVACQASLSITNSRSSLKLTSIESVMPSSHVILCRPLFLLPPVPPSIRVLAQNYYMCNIE